MTEEAPEKEENALQMWVAILIAVATVIGALIAWRASVADDGSGDADFAGLHATINANETRALNAVDAYENYGGYTAYWRNRELGSLIAADEAKASDEEAQALDPLRMEANNLAVANQYQFNSKYIDRTGKYNLQRQIGEMWTDAARKKDLNPAPQFQEADALRAKTLRLLLAVMIMALGTVFYSLIESVEEGKMQYVLVAIGTLLFIGGTVFGVLVEFGVM